MYPLAAGVHKCFNAGLALLVARREVWCRIAAETEGFFVHDDVDVLGEALDEFPCLGEGGAALEGEIPAAAGQGEEFAQQPFNGETPPPKAITRTPALCGLNRPRSTTSPPTNISISGTLIIAMATFFPDPEPPRWTSRWISISRPLPGCHPAPQAVISTVSRDLGSLPEFF